jgi:non-specific serine/threonine protein kinase
MPGPTGFVGHPSEACLYSSPAAAVPATDSIENTVQFDRHEAAPPDGEFDGRDALPAGTRLGEFEILCVLGTGGFGIVYLALDHALMRQVAIKEYMPSSLALRGRGEWVALRAPQHAATFAAGLKSFINEAQLLASFDHPSLLKVHRFWEGSGTAYMVMQYYPGQTLKQARKAMDGPPGEAWLRALVGPVLEALEVLHAGGVFHRDVSPDNILLQVDGPPVLLDFGAARKVIGDRTQTLTAILKPSFAPVEQYADVAGMRQGPWTDLYALAAVVHYTVTGQPPVPAVARAVRDSQRPLTSDPGELSPQFLACIDWALAVAPEDRPQNVFEMVEALAGRLARPEPAPQAVPAPVAPAPAASEMPFPRNRWVRGLAAGVAVGLATVTFASAAFRVVDRQAPAPEVAAVTALPAVAASAVAASAVAAIPLAAAPAAASRPAVRRKLAQSRPDGGGPSSPDEACADRNFFMKAVCVNRECGSSRFQQHPQCVAMRHDQESRRHERGG